MKNIIDVLQEMEGGVTPMNTMGMGNPVAPTETQPGSEPISTIVGPKKEKKNTSKKKKDIQESILDVDKLDNIKPIIFDWLAKVGFAKHAEDWWYVTEDGVMGLKEPKYAKYCKILMDNPEKFPGKWADDCVVQFLLTMTTDLDYKNLNLPEKVDEIVIASRGKIKLDLTGLKSASELKIDIQVRDIPSIKFDSGLKVETLKIHDGVWNNDNLSKLQMKFPKGVTNLQLPKKTAESILSKTLGPNTVIE